MSLRRRARTLAGPHDREGQGPDEEGRAASRGSSVIGTQTRFKGRLKGQGAVMVCGTFLGEVDLAGPLTLARTGRIEANVDVHSASLSGTVKGTLRASSRVRLAATARFEGEIATPVIDLHPGSVLRGHAAILGRRDRPAVR